MNDTARYLHIRRAVFGSTWAIHPAKLSDILALLELRAAGATVTEADVKHRLNGEGTTPRRPTTSGAVAVVPITGVLCRRMNLMSEFSGGTSTEILTSQIRAAVADPAVSAIALVVDSPGGNTDGVTELAGVIRAARDRKRIVASVDTLCASAAYWLAAQATEIACTPSGHVGSIGVMTAHQCIKGSLEKAGIETTIIAEGQYKAEGNPYEPLTEEAKAAMRGLVASAYRQFVDDVAKGRRTTAAAVRAGYGKGRLLAAEEARTAGLVDRIEPLDDTLARLQASPASRPLAARQGRPSLVARDALWWQRAQLELLKL